MPNRGEHSDANIIAQIWHQKKTAFREILFDCRCSFTIEPGSLTAANQKEILGLTPQRAQTISKAIPTIRIELPPARLQRVRRVIEKLATDLKSACWLLQPYFQYFEIAIHRSNDSLVLHNTHQRITLLEVPGYSGAYIHWKVKDVNELARFLLNPLEYWQSNSRDIPYADNRNQHFHPPTVWCP